MNSQSPNSASAVRAASKTALAGAWDLAQRCQCAQVLEEDVAVLIRRAAETQDSLLEAEESQQGRQRALLLDLIEISDGFERVFTRIAAHPTPRTPQTDAWVNNFRTLYRLLSRTLKAQGVARLEDFSGVYDPERHLPQTRVFDLKQPEHSIVRQERAGYVWRDILLRKAEVAVVTHKEEEAAVANSCGAGPDGT